MKNKPIISVISIMIVAFICIIPLVGCVGYMNEQKIECEIKDKWIKRPSGSDDEIYLVNCGGTTYKISDLLWKGKFNSADIYGNLEVGKTYEITTTGYRWGYFSEYQNINSYKEISNEKVLSKDYIDYKREVK